MGFRRRWPLTGSALSSTLALWTQPGFVKSVQRGSATIAANGTTATATITAVVPANCIISFLGQNTSASDTTSDAQTGAVSLTNATTVTATRINATPDVNTLTCQFEVLEFAQGVIKSVQRGTIAGLSGTTKTVSAIVTGKSQLSLTGYNIATTGAWDGQNVPYLVLTNSTTITMTIFNGAQSVTAFYQLVEFY